MCERGVDTNLTAVVIEDELIVVPSKLGFHCAEPGKTQYNIEVEGEDVKRDMGRVCVRKGEGTE